jgi:ribosomal protein S18 acetylase RimI-like enzyme
MKIEKAKPEDIEDISKVVLGCRNYKNRKFDPIPTLKKIFNDKKESIFIVKDKSQTIGYITLKADKNVGEIGYLAVLKKYQNRGIAKRLLKYTIRIAKNHNIKKLVLEVRNDNARALSLYSKQGFVVIGILKVKKFKITKLKMEKIL